MNDATSTKARSNRKSYFEEFSNSTTCHGVVNLYESRTWPWKLFWAMIITMSFGVICYEVQKVVKQHIDHPTSTRVQFQQVKYLEVPDMSFCPPHRVNWTYAQDNNISIALLEYMYSSILSTYAHNPDTDDDAVDMEIQYQEFMSSKPGFDIVDLFLKGGLVCTEFVKACMFEGREVKNCCSEHMQEILMHHGKCFLFSPNIAGRPARQVYGGPSHGVSILFNLHPGLIAPTFHNSFISEALFINIGHVHLSRYPVPMDNNPIMVPTGMHAYVSLEVQEYKYMVGYGCSGGSVGKKLRFFDGYEKQACLYECILNATLKYCGCVMMGYNISRHLSANEKICEPKQSTECVTANFFGDSENAFNQYVRSCDSGCTAICDYFEYKPVSVMLANYPAHTAEAALRHEYNSNPVDPSQREFVLLNVFLSRISISQTIEFPSSSIDNLVGSVGGQLGLFAGCSIITIIHAIITLLQSCIGQHPSGQQRNPEQVFPMRRSLSEETNKPPVTETGSNPTFWCHDYKQ